MSCKRRRRRSDAADQQGRAIKKSRRNSKRNWVELPVDIMLVIFMKLGAVEILVNAQNVCSYWKRLAKEPLLYRCLDFQGAEKYTKDKPIHLERLGIEAVDRSCGQLVKLSTCEGSGWDDIMHYIIKHTQSSLKSVEFRRRCRMTGITMAEIVGGLDSVEELYIHYPSFVDIAIEAAGRTCQKLVSLHIGVDSSYMDVKRCEQSMSVIVRNLPNIRRLTLEGFQATNKGLQTILDGCPLLEHFDFQHCFCDQVHKNLLSKCSSKIRN